MQTLKVIGAGILAGLIGAAIWAGVAYATHREVGLVAWGIGALVGAGVEPRALIEQLELLGVGGWQIDFEKVDRSGISATYARVHTAHEHAHRRLRRTMRFLPAVPGLAAHPAMPR